MQRMDVLAAIRLSQLSDVTTSPERQREHPQRWAKAHGGVVVDEAIDLGVSGAVSPFERPELGPWLTDNPPKPWDVLVAWRLDRVSRNALDTLLLLRWLEERGKRLVTVADGLDSAGPFAKPFFTLAAVFAEMERTVMTERTAEARAKLLTDGKWVGGTIPHGYRVAADGRLEIDPKTAPEARRVFQLAAQKTPYAEIARRMGDGWYLQKVKRLIRNPVYVGLGTPVTPAMVSPETFESAQRPLKAQIKKGSAELSGVAVCLKCEHPMWVRRQKRWGKDYQYYYCKAHGSIRSDVVEELAIIEFVGAVGDEPVIDEVVHPDTTASDAALCRVELAMLAAKLADGDRDKILARMTELSGRLTELESHGAGGDRVEYVDTGRMWREEVDRLTLAELGGELRRRDIRIGLQKIGSEIEVRMLS